MKNQDSNNATHRPELTGFTWTLRRVWQEDPGEPFEAWSRLTLELTAVLDEDDEATVIAWAQCYDLGNVGEFDPTDVLDSYDSRIATYLEIVLAGPIEDGHVAVLDAIEINPIARGIDIETVVACEILMATEECTSIVSMYDPLVDHREGLEPLAENEWRRVWTNLEMKRHGKVFWRHFDNSDLSLARLTHGDGVLG